MAIPSLGIAGFIITMFVVPWMYVFFTLEYIKSTEEITFPALAVKRPPNSGSPSPPPARPAAASYQKK
jgi:hypothetical protein